MWPTSCSNTCYTSITTTTSITNIIIIIITALVHWLTDSTDPLFLFPRRYRQLPASSIGFCLSYQSNRQRSTDGRLCSDELLSTLNNYNTQPTTTTTTTTTTRTQPAVSVVVVLVDTLTAILGRRSYTRISYDSLRIACDRRAFSISREWKKIHNSPLVAHHFQVDQDNSSARQPPPIRRMDDAMCGVCCRVCEWGMGRRVCGRAGASPSSLQLVSLPQRRHPPPRVAATHGGRSTDGRTGGPVR